MKKTYEIPSVEIALLNPGAIICGSPAVLDIIDQGTGDIIPPGGGPIIGG